MLAENWTPDQDATGYLMSEKLDGVRALWNGSNLYSRQGNIFAAPKFFTEKFPKNCILDGELFLERGEFSATISIVKKKDPHDGWKQIKYIVFDGPCLKGDFEIRITKLKKMFEKLGSEYL